ncbi:hypothetical protein PTTG_03270 [Puccinia triticina 1-1 BBBD Race 1]|uniref:Uncharacterized protein n=1 Tax=Puccinia triticina (isolate 1-1 / race 1 (BBBD)) TaxID=630390 RepID=A0A180GIQ6_PUCT1|nr:hypothetical protein PTTG_03270 [Puccinia triticina 1-1 BBBD Race 1]WAR57189.1 hypothetical protein PtB15_8B236 [Puccinia triticina]
MSDTGTSVTPSSTPQNGAQQTGTATRRGLSPACSDSPARRQHTGNGGLPPGFNLFQPLGGEPPVPDLPTNPIVLPPNKQYLVNIGVPVIPQAEVAALKLMTKTERVVIIMSSLRVLIGCGGDGPGAGRTGPKQGGTDPSV